MMFTFALIFAMISSLPRGADAQSFEHQSGVASTTPHVYAYTSPQEADTTFQGTATVAPVDSFLCNSEDFIWASAGSFCPSGYRPGAGCWSKNSGGQCHVIPGLHALGCGSCTTTPRGTTPPGCVDFAGVIVSRDDNEHQVHTTCDQMTSIQVVTCNTRLYSFKDWNRSTVFGKGLTGDMLVRDLCPVSMKDMCNTCATHLNADPTMAPVPVAPVVNEEFTCDNEDFIWASAGSFCPSTYRP